jgi:hypothetical protein
MITLAIDPEFRALCPPLTPDEYEQLTANLLADGCREPLVVWAGPPQQRRCPRCEAKGHETTLEESRALRLVLVGNRDEAWQLRDQIEWTCPRCRYTEQQPWTILDGHHRYQICQQHGLVFSLREVPRVTTRDEAIDWIIENQLGRRNLNEQQQWYLRGKRRNLIKMIRSPEAIPVKSPIHDENMHDATIPITTKELAKEYGVNESTVIKDGQFAAALDLMSDHDPKIRAQVLSGHSPLTKQEVIDAGKALAKDKTLAEAEPDWKQIAARQRRPSLAPVEEWQKTNFAQTTLKLSSELNLYLRAIERAGGILEMAEECSIKTQKQLIARIEEQWAEIAAQYADLKRDWNVDNPRTIDLSREDRDHG